MEPALWGRAAIKRSRKEGHGPSRVGLPGLPFLSSLGDDHRNRRCIRSGALGGMKRDPWPLALVRDIVATFNLTALYRWLKDKTPNGLSDGHRVH